MIKEMLEYANKSTDTILVKDAVDVIVGSLVEMSERSPIFNDVKNKLTVNEYDHLMSSITCSLVGTIIVRGKKNEQDVKEFFKMLHITDAELEEIFKKKFNQA